MSKLLYQPSDPFGGIKGQTFEILQLLSQFSISLINFVLHEEKINILTLYSIVKPQIFKNIMENGAFALLDILKSVHNLT